jgi:hypothetical protein
MKALGLVEGKSQAGTAFWNLRVEQQFSRYFGK